MADAGVESVANDIEADTDPALALAALLGGNLRRLRISRGLSLERLAASSGVSRATLSQIETGKSAPSITVLWKIATSLSVPFASLISEPDKKSPAVIRLADSKVLISSEGAFTSRALFPFSGARNSEFYELKLAPRHLEIAEPHAAGTRENLVVVVGAVEIVVGRDAPTALGEGDAILFLADQPHSYRNLGGAEAVLHLVMTYVEPVG